MKRDHDLIGWVILGGLGLVLGLLMLATFTLPGLVLTLIGVGVTLAAVMRYRRTSGDVASRTPGRA